MENQTINLLEFAKGLSDREITLSIPILKVDTNRNHTSAVKVSKNKSLSSQ